MRRIACALEAVELEGGERVARRDLVDDEDAASGSCHAHDLRHDVLRPGDVVQRAQGSDEVERAALEVETRRVAFHEGDVRVRGRTGARLLEQLGDEVDSDDLAHVRREREGERPCPRADVERTLVARGEHERSHALLELGGASVLARGDQVGLRAEAGAHDVVTLVRHRSPSAAHAAASCRCPSRARR